MAPITLFHGGRSADFLSLPDTFSTVELEPLVFTAANTTLSTPDGSDPGSVLRRRRRCLTESLRRLKPRIVLLEHFPFGRWGFSEEILPLIECCRTLNPRPQLWSSVREIPILSEYDYNRMTGVAQEFDRMFVHSDPRVFPLDLGRPLPEAVEKRIEYTGYVTPTANGNVSRLGHVLVHAGGGLDSKPFWEAVKPIRLAMKQVEFECCGKHPAELASLPSVTLLLRSAWRSISMGGYNTVAEWLAFRTPTIFVPRQSDPEQIKRVRRLQECVGGPMRISDADPEALRLAWDSLRDDEPFRPGIWINGQERFANAARPYLQ
jgi:predicted glycosyltransferase